MTLIDTLETKLSRYAIPNLTLILLAGQFLAFITTTIRPQTISYYILTGQHLFSAQLWRAVTFLFIPIETNYFFAIFFFLIYYSFGTGLERFWGDARYNLYIGLAVAATIASSLTFPTLIFTNTYIFLSIFLAFAHLNPENRIYIFFILPVKLRFISYLFWAGFIFAIIYGSPASRISSLIAIANFLLFFGSDLLASIKHTAKNQQLITPNLGPTTYHHQCATCGKTDASHPDLEFRYCPDCVPPRAYCPQHITKHSHK